MRIAIDAACTIENLCRISRYVARQLSAVGIDGVAMSALGQKRTCAAQKPMSALPPKADIQLRHRAHLTALDHRALSRGNAFPQFIKGFSQQILHFWYRDR